MLKLIGLVAFSYLLGSFPSAYIATEMKKGLDIRKVGTRNAGASNVLLVAGPLLAVLVYIIDLFKGIVPVLLARNIIGTDISMGLCGLAAILGHDYSVFLRFTGGKGVATTTGVMFGINSVIISIVIVAWPFLVAAFNNFILASLICMLFIPVLMYSFKLSAVFIAFGISYFLVGLYTHREDIVRIIKGKHIRASEGIREYFGKA